DSVERGPGSRRPTGPAIDDQVVRVLGDFPVEVVHEHPEGRLLLPATAGEVVPTRGANGAGTDRAHRVVQWLVDGLGPGGPKGTAAGRAWRGARKGGGRPRGSK